MTSASPSLTQAEVVSIIGPQDTEIVARIIRSGASAADVLEAFTFFNAEDSLGPDPGHHASGAVATVYGILASAQDAGEDERA